MNQQIHTISYLKQGTGYVNVTVDLFCIGIDELRDTRNKQELQNETFLPTDGPLCHEANILVII